MTEYRVLTRLDLSGFDGEARALVLAMSALGWTGRITSRGHALLRAPDGSATACVSRSSLRGRSGRNAAAHFERWRRGTSVDDSGPDR